MGNRAVIVFSNEDFSNFGPSVYLHWNGGPESIYPFLGEMARRKVGAGDIAYQTARFIHVACDLLDADAAGGMSIGVSNGCESLKALESYSPGDNGVYLICYSRENPVVRRFVGYPERWLSPEEVEGERQAAMRHQYNTGEQTMASEFVKMRPKISEY